MEQTQTQTLTVIRPGITRIEVEYKGAKYRLNKHGVAFSWSERWDDYVLDLDIPFSLQDEITDILVSRGATYEFDRGDRVYEYWNVDHKPLGA